MADFPAFPIIDSHIHLWPASHLDTLAWHSDSNPLGSQYSIDEYRNATGLTRQTLNSRVSESDRPNLRGFIYLETDRKTGLRPEDWRYPLEELSYLARISTDTPLQTGDEGHGAPDSELCLGIVPWAPVPAGAQILEQYFDAARKTVGDDVWPLIKGARYLVQDKPKGTMLKDGFVEGVKWLGARGLLFELGIDARSGGPWQLEEAVEMCDKIFADVEPNAQTSIVINHFCKPNLQIDASDAPSHSEFKAWSSAIKSLASYPTTTMKLSGFFSELPTQPEPSEGPIPVEDIVKTVRPWTDIVFDAFGPSRIMFGSDWPVCEVGGKGTRTWKAWIEIVQRVMVERGLGNDEMAAIWSDNAARVYSVAFV